MWINALICIKCFLRDSKWNGKYSLAGVSDLAWGWRWAKGWSSSGSRGIYQSLSSDENCLQAQPRTGILCNWRNCSIQQFLNKHGRSGKSRETWQIRAQCQPALISCSKEEAVDVAGENHKYCSAYWFILHWSPSTKWIWFILCKQQLFGRCLSFCFARWL